MNIKNISLLFFSLSIFSCNIKLKDFNPAGNDKIVISGMITDSLGNHKIYISEAKDIIDSGFSSPITNAIVIVTDNISITDTFQFTTLTLPGFIPKSLQGLESYYKPSKQWAGVKGRTYNLKVIANGTTYNATETMPNIQNYKIDSAVVTYRYQAVAAKGSSTVDISQYNQLGFTFDYINVGDSLFRVKLYAPNNDFGRVNTKISVYRNAYGTYIPYSDGTVYLNNSAEVPIKGFYLLPGQQGPPTYLYFKSGDKCLIVFQAISDNAYNYFSGVNAVENSDGGIFAAPAGNPPSNISGGALGYFYAAQMITKTVDIKYIPGVTQTDNSGR